MADCLASPEALHVEGTRALARAHDAMCEEMRLSLHAREQKMYDDITKANIKLKELWDELDKARQHPAALPTPYRVSLYLDEAENSSGVVYVDVQSRLGLNLSVSDLRAFRKSKCAEFRQSMSELRVLKSTCSRDIVTTFVMPSLANLDPCVTQVIASNWDATGVGCWMELALALVKECDKFPSSILTPALRDAFTATLKQTVSNAVQGSQVKALQLLKVFGSIDADFDTRDARDEEAEYSSEESQFERLWDYLPLHSKKCLALSKARAGLNAYVGRWKGELEAKKKIAQSSFELSDVLTKAHDDLAAINAKSSEMELAHLTEATPLDKPAISKALQSLEGQRADVFLEMRKLIGEVQTLEQRRLEAVDELSSATAAEARRRVEVTEFRRAATAHLEGLAAAANMAESDLLYLIPEVHALVETAGDLVQTVHKEIESECYHGKVSTHHELLMALQTQATTLSDLALIESAKVQKAHSRFLHHVNNSASADRDTPDMFRYDPSRRVLSEHLRDKVDSSKKEYVDAQLRLDDVLRKLDNVVRLAEATGAELQSESIPYTPVRIPEDVLRLLCASQAD